MDMALDYLYITVMIVAAFGLVILFHEFGHFVVAKLSGVEAPEFAFGMGPELFGFDRGGTRYKVCAFPIGGYVKMVGEDDPEPGEMDVPRERNFQYKSTPVKVAIIVAGPVMNLILGFILFASMFLLWGVERGVKIDMFSNRTIVDFADPRKPAGKAGIKKGDSILSVDGVKVKSPDHFSKLIGGRADRKTEIDLLREGKKVRIEVVPKPNSTTGNGEIGVAIGPPYPREVRSVERGSPAWKAGIRGGDVILDFNGEQFQGESYNFANPVKLLVYKAGSGKTLSVNVEAPGGGGDTGGGATLGANLYPMMEKLGFFSSMAYGGQETVRSTLLIASIVYMLITREVSTKEVSGPVGIIQYSAYFASTSVRQFVWFFGFISVNLAVLNLLPFPALDGSRVAIHTWEGIRGRPLDPRRVSIVHYAGFIFLISLLALITLRDILHLVR